jgi:predicted transposase YdaD
LKTGETQGHDQERYQWKKHFLLELYRKGMSREMIVALYEFISVIMALPEAKDEELYDEIKQTTEEKQMSILAIAERKGREEGREEERILGLRETISDILEIKFGMAGLKLFYSIEQITDIEALRKIRTGLKQAQSVAEAEVLIQTYIKE